MSPGPVYADTQPVIADVWDGVREYWFEEFRRMLVVNDGDEVLVVIDLYRGNYHVDSDGAQRLVAETASDIGISYVDVTRELRDLLDADVLSGELVVLSAADRRELIGIRLRLPPHAKRLVDSYDSAWSTYAAIVRAFEGRDPEKAPLQPPEPVYRVYRLRGL